MEVPRGFTRAKRFRFHLKLYVRHLRNGRIPKRWPPRLIEAGRGKRIKPRHCWFDFEDGDWTDDGKRIPGHTCMLEDGHDGPHEPTPDDEIGVTFA